MEIPQPVSTSTSMPRSTNRRAASGVIGTRVSAGLISLGMESFIGIVPSPRLTTTGLDKCTARTE